MGGHHFMKFGNKLEGRVYILLTPLPTRTQQLPTLSAQQCWELLRPFARSLRTGRNNLKTWQEQQEHNSKGDICYLENICGAEQPETCTIDDELNIDLIDAGKHVLAMFLNWELF